MVGWNWFVRTQDTLTISHRLSKGCTSLSNHCNHLWHLRSFGSLRHDSKTCFLDFLRNKLSCSKYCTQSPIFNRVVICASTADYRVPIPEEHPLAYWFLVFCHTLVLHRYPAAFKPWCIWIRDLSYSFFPEDHTIFFYSEWNRSDKSDIEGNI